MEHYLNAAVEQAERFEKYVKANPQHDRLANRRKFFGSQNELATSSSIIMGIAAYKKLHDSK